MKKFYALAVAAIALSACQKLDYYDPAYRDALYKSTWQDTFGDIDPEQDWNLATSTLAVINLTQEGVNDGKVQILTGNPSDGGSVYLLASTELSGGEATIEFDVTKSSPVVFVRVIGADSKIAYSTWGVISDGCLPIGALAEAPATRAAIKVKLGEKYVYEGTPGVPAVPDKYQRHYSTVSTSEYNLDIAKKYGDEEYLWFVETRTETKHIVVNEWYEYDEVTTFYIFVDINDNEYKVTNEWNIAGETGFKYNSLHNNIPLLLIPGTPEVPAGRSQTYQRLSGVEKANSTSWKVSDYYHIFGKGGYFEEQRDPSCLERWKNDFQPNVTFTISGQLTLDYMFGGTDHDNVFGYYYWQDGEDPIAATRYVLIADAQPSSNLTCLRAKYSQQWVVDNEVTYEGHVENVFTGHETKPSAIGDMELATWMVQGQGADNIITGTSYKVPYIAPDGKISYDFPNGTHIAFFLVVNGLNQNMNQWLYNTNMSVRDHNLEIGRTFTGNSRDNSDSDNTKGEIDAISFSYKGNIYLGFEDRGGDKDMNDIVFFVNGNATPEGDVVKVPEPKPDPTPDPTPDNPNPTPTPEVEPQPMQWIIACEDLGGLSDFDFNDIVLGVSHVAGETKAYITPLAAGGTMPAYILYNGNILGEIHSLFGSDDTKLMINTMAYEGDEGINKSANPIEINVPANFTVTKNMGGIDILVKVGENGSGNITYAVEAPQKGSTPQMILVPHTWLWPKEYVPINQVYKGFGTWGKNYGNDTWYQDCNEELAVPRR